MEQAPDSQHVLALVQQALELLGFRLSPVAPELLKAESQPLSRRPGAAFLVTTNPVWVSRAPGVVLVAPGSGPARRIYRGVRARGRFAVLVAGDLAHPGGLQRHLWFRFVLTVTSFALPEGARRSVIDVLAGGDALGPVRLPPGQLRIVARPQPAMAWVSPYEVQRLGEGALRVALRCVRARLAALCRRLDPAREAERKRLEQYFRDRRAEEMLPLRALYRRAAVALVYSRLTCDADRARRLSERAEALAALAGSQQKALVRRLKALDEEEALALAEVEERYRLRARLAPAGLAVVWCPPRPGAAGEA